MNGCLVRSKLRLQRKIEWRCLLQFLPNHIYFSYDLYGKFSFEMYLPIVKKP